MEDPYWKIFLYKRGNIGLRAVIMANDTASGVGGIGVGEQENTPSKENSCSWELEMLIFLRNLFFLNVD